MSRRPIQTLHPLQPCSVNRSVRARCPWRHLPGPNMIIGSGGELMRYQDRFEVTQENGFWKITDQDQVSATPVTQ